MPKTGAEELRSIMDKSGPEVRMWLRANVLEITGANRELRSLEALWVVVEDDSTLARFYFRSPMGEAAEPEQTTGHFFLSTRNLHSRA
ncbi:hypothetical protein Nepgr_008185 [Nepenthes gracilis]|uniref:Uncharacterized protein n=1 Tax=Nepenthes gracilis TaxID=150966 RepID=A0AAD3XJ55_NEPGR|nr:hypothetical protein Nepgr_008185 [Nepenthes gracilis]